MLYHDIDAFQGYAFHEQLRLDSIKSSFMFVCLGLFDKQAELKQKKLFVNKLVNNTARYKTCRA